MRSSQPDRTFIAARFIASSPEPQHLLICIPGTSISHPAYWAAVLPIFAPWSPTGITHPIITSSISEVFSSCLSESASISLDKRSVGVISCREPFFFLPLGVLIVSYINDSFITICFLIFKRIEKKLSLNLCYFT